MPFERNNTDAQKRKDRGSESEGKRRRSSSLVSMPWSPSQLALLGHYLVLEGADARTFGSQESDGTRRPKSW
jgi:hypothetical protein